MSVSLRVAHPSQKLLLQRQSHSQVVLAVQSLLERREIPRKSFRSAGKTVLRENLINYFFSLSIEVVDGLVRSVVTNAAVTPSEKLRSELLVDSHNIIGDYKCALTALHDRLVNGKNNISLGTE